MNPAMSGGQGNLSPEQLQRIMQQQQQQRIHPPNNQFTTQQMLAMQQQKYQVIMQQQQQQLMQQQQHIQQHQMVPQQPHQIHPNGISPPHSQQDMAQQIQASNSQPNNPANPSAYVLDAADVAKQMAAIQAAGRSRAMSSSANMHGFGNQGSRPGTAPGGPDGSGIPAPPPNLQLQSMSMTPMSNMGVSANNNNPNQNQQRAQQQAQQQANALFNSLVNNRPSHFLPALAEFMTRAGHPLPPSVTGIPTPAYDPSTSRFRMLQGGSVPGTVKIAGKDVDLHAFLVFMIQKGGGAKHQSDAATWEAFANHSGLPLTAPNPNPGQPDLSTVQILQYYYANILMPFEGQWSKVMQHKMLMIRNQQAAMQQATAANGGQQPSQQQVAALQAQMFANSNSNSHGMAGMPSSHVQQQQAGQQNMPQQQHNLAHQMLAPQQQSSGMQPPKSENMPQHPAEVPFNQRSPQRPTGPFAHQTSPIAHQFPHQQFPQSSAMSSNSAPVSSPEAAGTPGGDGTDSEGRKRKRASAEIKDGKRSRLSDSNEGPGGLNLDQPQSSPFAGPGLPAQQSPTRSAAPSAPIPPQPLTSQRLKIEYRPMSRLLNTYGGRNLQALEHHRDMVQSRRIIRHVEEWGEVEIETIIMSLRSRLALEVSYALTTLTILSTVTFPGGLGLPLKHCEDLLAVLIDLLEETAFPDSEPEQPAKPSQESRPRPTRGFTHQELIREASEQGSGLFSGLEVDKDPVRFGMDPNRGPRDRAGDVVLCIFNLLRNFTMFPDNQESLAEYPRALDVMMRICGISSNRVPDSKVLTLVDLVKVHDHMLTTLANLAGPIRLSLLLPQTPPRIFRLMASYFNSSNTAVSPFKTVNPEVRHQSPLPPAISDLALEAFSRMAQSDSHRRLFSKAIPEDELFAVFRSLVHMMPVSMDDYTIMVLSANVLEPWVGYAEKVVLSLYNLAFLAPVHLKRRLRKLPGFVAILMRLIRFYMKGVRPDGATFIQAHALDKNGFAILCRRGMEVLKILDDGEDLFAEGIDDNGATFGIGFGEPDAMNRHRGLGCSNLNGESDQYGLLAGDWEEVFEKMMCKEGVDDLLFADVESLVRLGTFG